MMRKRPSEEGVTEDPRIGETPSTVAIGAICLRCGHTIKAGDEVRRTLAGDWVHIAC